MKLTKLAEAATDWSRIPATTVPGASGVAKARAHQAGELRLRLVEYGPGYLADHWCSKGHIIHVLSGALTIEHQDGSRAYVLSAGMSWYAADEEGPAHRARSETGATVFIVD
ncbi:MAG: DHCW motif cupin fold protein [Rhizomicrobium sp.]|jgi:quercetin dioxygenase-like cupin family protein